METLPPRIAVTGASGHIGNVVCRSLVLHGYRVRAMYHRDTRPLEGVDAERAQGDILNPEDVTRLLDGCDAVIHCAAIISIDGDPTGMVFRTNTEGPRNVLDAARQTGIRRIVHVSSVHAVTELPHSEPYDETRPYKGKQHPAYDYSKATGEQILREGVRDTGIDLVIVRPSAVLGPYDFKPSKLGAALLDFYHQRIPLLPEGGYDLVDVRDVAHSTIAALEHGRSGEAYVLSGMYFDFRKLARVIGEVTGKRVPQRVIPYVVLKAMLPFVRLQSAITGAAPSLTRESIDAVKYGHPRMDHGKARLELGHDVRPLEDTLRDFYAWQKEHHKL